MFSFYTTTSSNSVAHRVTACQENNLAADLSQTVIDVLRSAVALRGEQVGASLRSPRDVHGTPREPEYSPSLPLYRNVYLTTSPLLLTS